jgi:hypothetical protein
MARRSIGDGERHRPGHPFLVGRWRAVRHWKDRGYNVLTPPGSRFFVRDDDVGDLTPELRAFAETFIRKKIPVSYQIIPSKFTDACARYMRNLFHEHPELIDFGQHGLRHEMIVRGRHTWREFGPEHSTLEQQRTIEEGRALLSSKLGETVELRVFTPPQHKYNGDTVRAAAAAGYCIFSASSYPFHLHRFLYRIGRSLNLSSLRHHGISYHCRRRPEAPIVEISIAIPVDNGISLRNPAATLPAALSQAMKYTNVVGFMFHHAVYGRPGGQRELTALAEALSNFGAARFRRLSALRPDSNGYQG